MNKAFCKQLLTEFVVPLLFISLFFGMAAVWPLDWLSPSTASTEVVPDVREDVKKPVTAIDGRRLAGGAPSVSDGLKEAGAITR